MSDATTLPAGRQEASGFRTCEVTGLQVHGSAESLIKLFGVTAVVALAIGGTAALFVALTRWEAVGLLGPWNFYKILSLHAWNLLIFWMVFMEVAILYLGGPVVLGRRVPMARLAKVGYGVMVAAALLIDYAILATKLPDQPPLLTSYAPLRSSPLFYLGAIVFILGTVIAAVPFFATLWQERVENPGSSLPLVTFGAFMTGIIAVEALVGGLIVYIPTFLWRIGLLPHIDAAWYRQMYWIIGHGTQQINLLAMITVWYFLTHVTAGAEVASEKISRTAFILYLFFINMGAAHHLLVDPAESAGWRLWNTSYAMYGAVLASLIHAFAVPAGLEVGRRRRGLGGGLFGWLRSAPWWDPGFSASIFSLFMFGFLGGITGVLMGQMQLNLTRHNTFSVVGHFHATVALGTTLTFMGLTYYVIRLIFRKRWVGAGLIRLQPYFYAAAMGLTVIAMMDIGVVYGVPRRDPGVMSIPGTSFNFAPAKPMFAIFGIAAVLAILAGAIYVGASVASLLFGKRARLSPMMALSEPPGESAGGAAHLYSMRGTLVLCLSFLATLGVLFTLDWSWLGRLWHIGP